ncbi:hypothetical protein KM043_000030, partial [Ampulex compressa]
MSPGSGRRRGTPHPQSIMQRRPEVNVLENIDRTDDFSDVDATNISDEVSVATSQLQHSDSTIAD